MIKFIDSIGVARFFNGRGFIIMDARKRFFGDVILQSVAKQLTEAVGLIRGRFHETYIDR